MTQTCLAGIAGNGNLSGWVAELSTFPLAPTTENHWVGKARFTDWFKAGPGSRPSTTRPQQTRTTDSPIR
jgi:hypothetical protein